eukprot:scaffold1527_cov145-Skeletonema_menzelii.AAC.6
MAAYRDRRISGSSSGNHAPSTNTESEQTNLIISAEEAARQKRSGQSRRRMEKAARREDRIAQLENMDNRNDSSSNNNNGLSDSERAELRVSKRHHSYKEWKSPMDDETTLSRQITAIYMLQMNLSSLS